MEGDKSGKRKRRRDGGDDEKTKEFQKGKKLPAEMNSMGNNFHNINDDEIKFCDGIGVFDFPWLKEGVIFKADDYLEAEADNFAACSYDQQDHETFTENLCVFPDGNLQEINKLDDESLWSSLQVDDLEPVDRIWSCVVDQPLLHKMGLNRI